MAILPKLPSAQSDIQLMRHFYKRQNTPNQYKHIHAVYQKAVRYSIIDEGIIRDESKDAWLRTNHLLRRRLALIHVIDSAKLQGSPGILPPGFVDDALLGELDIYEKLTALERRGAPKQEFLELLNNGKRPLAPFIKIPDFSLTHDTEDELTGFIANGKPSIIRQYASVAEARLAMKLDLKAAEKLWAPLAAFYGYQEISGDIFEQSYRVNHPEIYSLVVENLADESTRERIARTQALSKELSNLVAATLESYGFEVDASVRMLKHRGKQMEKVMRLLAQEHENLSPGGLMSRDEYVTSHLSGFDFKRFNDLVAVRAIASRIRGASIDKSIKEAGYAVEPEIENKPMDLCEVHRLLDCIRIPALRLAVKLIADTITSLPHLYPHWMNDFSCYVEFKKNKRGYRSFHFDTQAQGIGGAILVPFEIQLRTPKWHFISQRGGAAHYLIKGGDSGEGVDRELVDTLGNAYRDLLHDLDPDAPASLREEQADWDE